MGGALYLIDYSDLLRAADSSRVTWPWCSVGIAFCQLAIFGHVSPVQDIDVRRKRCRPGLYGMVFVSARSRLSHRPGFGCKMRKYTMLEHSIFLGRNSGVGDRIRNCIPGLTRLPVDWRRLATSCQPITATQYMLRGGHPNVCLSFGYN